MYSSPIEITESGTLLVKVDQENYVKKIYEFDFVKEKPIDAVRIKNKVVGLNYKYFEGVDVVVHSAAFAHEGLSVFTPYLITKNI